MMRLTRLVGLAALVAASAAIGAGTGAGMAAGAAGPAQRPRPTTAAGALEAAQVRAAAARPATLAGAEKIVLVEPYSNDFKFVNVDGAKEGAGDYYLWRDPLVDPRRKNRVGATHGVCTLNYLGINVCNADVVIFGRGIITFAGPQTDYPFVLPITGGTGDFQNARGQVFTENIDKKTDRVTLRILK